MDQAKIIALLPVFNDWPALQELIGDLKKLLPDETNRLELLIVDDGSFETIPKQWQCAFPTTVITLNHNIGHQKAIAVGLSYIYHNIQCNKVLVMDADGDDQPEEAMKLLNASEKNPSKIIVGWRALRHENAFWKFLYGVYLFFFRVLTGQSVRFGNFSVLPFETLKHLVFKADVWLHFPGGIIKSKLPYLAVPTLKGKRYHGQSKMNLFSLFYHGVSALAAFIDVIAIRLLIASGVAIGFSLLGLLTILIIKLTTTLAIPGWASILGSSIIVIILISFLIALFLLFTFLSSQSYRKLIPAIHYKEFIEKEQKL